MENTKQRDDDIFKLLLLAGGLYLAYMYFNKNKIPTGTVTPLPLENPIFLPDKILNTDFQSNDFDYINTSNHYDKTPDFDYYQETRGSLAGTRRKARLSGTPLTC